MTSFFGSVFWLLVTLGVLVTFHEFGHYWVARRCGVKVLRFSVGFGRAIWKRVGRDGTEYQIAAIPLGGYVKMLDAREGEVDPALRAQEFTGKSVWKRIAIVAAGPGFNLIFTIVAFWAMFMLGKPDVAPVVTATPTVVSGSITGYVPAAQAGATVYAEQNGQVIRGTVADSTGKFVLSPLIQSSSNGTYDVVVVDNASPGHATGIISAVPVTASAATTVSTSTAPILLPSSTTNTVSGTVTASAQATLRALQTINSVSYEIASANAYSDTGAYSLALPAAAPLIGTYSPTLPITLSPVSSVAGQYSVQATSATGATQSVPENVSAGSQSNVNFTF